MNYRTYPTTLEESKTTKMIGVHVAPRVGAQLRAALLLVCVTLWSQQTAHCQRSGGDGSTVYQAPAGWHWVGSAEAGGQSGEIRTYREMWRPKGAGADTSGDRTFEIQAAIGQLAYAWLLPVNVQNQKKKADEIARMGAGFEFRGSLELPERREVYAGPVLVEGEGTSEWIEPDAPGYADTEGDTSRVQYPTTDGTYEQEEGFSPMEIAIGIGAGLLLLSAAGWAVRALWFGSAAVATTPVAISIANFVAQHETKIVSAANRVLTRSREIVGMVTDGKIGPTVREFIREMNHLRGGPNRMSMDELREAVRLAGVEFTEVIWAIIELYKH